MTVELLYSPGCPNYAAAVNLVRNVLDAHDLSADFIQTPVSNYEEAEARNFRGSPTLRVNGQDIENIPSDRLQVGFSCRTYSVEGRLQGIPPRYWLEQAILAAQTSEENQ